MKYTIELTDNQKKQMDLLCELAHRYIGFNPKLEPMNIINAELIPELKKQEYTKGYNSAINDCNEMIQWLHDCKDDFKKFMNKKYGYDVMYLTNPKVDEGVMLYDLICDHDMAEVISEFKVWQEEKKKAEEEIKIGDEVDFNNESKGVVISINEHYLRVVMDDGFVMSVLDGEVKKKTGKNFSTEVEQLLSKLKERDNEQ